MATDEEWRALRAALADVASQAAIAGYASERFGHWRISVQRRSVRRWPQEQGQPDAELVVTLQQHEELVQQWLAELRMNELLMRELPISEVTW